MFQKLCAKFDDQYWLERDSDGNSARILRCDRKEGWLGIAMPENTGSGLGITELLPWYRHDH
jgi:acyl-CoA dehydrogenase